MTTHDLFERRLTRTLHDVLDGQPLPHPFWADAPAATRIARHPMRRGIKPLRLLAIAALLVVGGGAAAAGAWFLRTELPRPTPQLLNEVVVPTPQLHNESLKPTLQQATPSPQPATPTAQPSQPPEPTPEPQTASDGWIALNTYNGWTDDIYFVGPDGVMNRVVGSDGDTIWESCPTFSPDGKKLAFLETLDDSSDTTEGVLAIAILDDNGLPQLPPARIDLHDNASCPSWSPDGSYLEVQTDSGLRVIDAITLSSTLLASLGQVADGGQSNDYSVSGFAWGWDGQSLLYIKSPSVADGELELAELWTTQLDGTGDHRLIALEPGEVIDDIRSLAPGRAAITTHQLAKLSDGGFASSRFTVGEFDPTNPATGITVVDAWEPDDNGSVDQGATFSRTGSGYAYVRQGDLFVGSTVDDQGSVALGGLGRPAWAACVIAWSVAEDAVLVVASDQPYLDRGVNTAMLEVPTDGSRPPRIVLGWGAAGSYAECHSQWQAVAGEWTFPELIPSPSPDPSNTPSLRPKPTPSPPPIPVSASPVRK